jgi:hypothetical protein
VATASESTITRINVPMVFTNMLLDFSGSLPFGQNGDPIVAHNRSNQGYEDPVKFDRMTKGKTWRQGKDFWTVLDTNLPLRIAGKEVPRELTISVYSARRMAVPGVLRLSNLPRHG